jgi:hypothetical protein
MQTRLTRRDYGQARQPSSLDCTDHGPAGGVSQMIVIAPGRSAGRLVCLCLLLLVVLGSGLAVLLSRPAPGQAQSGAGTIAVITDTVTIPTYP